MKRGTPALPFLIDIVMRFLAWWREELWGLVPGPVRRWFADTHAGVVLAQVETGFQLITEPSQRVRDGTHEVLSRAQAVAALAEMASSRRLGSVGIRLPLSQCLERRVELPRVPQDDLRRMLNFDIERATPFRLGEVYTAHLTTGEAAAKGKLRVRQFIVKRTAVDALVTEVRAVGVEPVFADCWQTTPTSGLPVNFLAVHEPPRSGLAGLATPLRVLALLVVLLAGAAFMLWPSSYETALADITSRTAKLRTAAAAVRGAIERADAALADLGRLQQMRLKQAPVVEIVDELSRVLPDSVWLTDLRIQGHAVDIVGLAKSGAALPSLFVGSGLFADASLTAPVTLDSREDKERFSLRLSLRQPHAQQSAAAGKQ
jgi:general secretion pathway protein L